MNEMIRDLDPEAPPLGTGQKEQSLFATYDFCKHLSGLALVAVGGMLALAQAVGAKPNATLLVPVAIMSAVAFLCLLFMAITAGTQILGRTERTSVKLAFGMVMINVMLFSASVSAFVTGFLKNLTH
ncbi:hypothetical protein GCM10022281_05400 [Sphingomonas rosea]|uniref:Uncharacterized protein n=1 Tax=Sphingomonas rosea TaxID=335605 RepID=A0ABP7TP26_9SPHN